MLHLIKSLSIRLVAMAALLPLLGVVAVGCSESESPVTHENVTLRFKVYTGLNTEISRAGEPNYYESAEGEFESISTLRVIITRPGNSGTRVLEANKLVSTSSNGYPSDKLEFSVNTGYRYRVYLIANEDALPSPLPAFKTTRAFLDAFEANDQFKNDVIDRWTVSAPAVAPNITDNIFSNINGGTTGMPLTEVFEVVPTTTRTASEDAPMIREESTYDVHLFMTRAACKVTYKINVAPDYKAKGVSLTAIRLEGLDQVQYVFPNDATYSPTKNPEELPNIDNNGSFVPTERYITSFNVPADNTLLNYPILLPADKYVPIQGGQKATFGPYYFPESKFTSSASKFGVSVRLSDSDQWLPVKYLGTGNNNILTMNGIQGIARNTHLVVNINFNRPSYPDNPQDDPGGVDITWNAVVAPYNELALYPEFGL